MKLKSVFWKHISHTKQFWTGFMNAVMVMNFMMPARTSVLIFMMTAQTSGLKMMMATWRLSLVKCWERCPLQFCLQMSLHKMSLPCAFFPSSLSHVKGPRVVVMMKRETKMDIGLNHRCDLLKCMLLNKLWNHSFMCTALAWIKINFLTWDQCCFTCNTKSQINSCQLLISFEKVLCTQALH